MGKKRKEFICPKCGNHLSPYLGFKAGLIYECNICGYIGPIALTEKNAPHVKED